MHPNDPHPCGVFDEETPCPDAHEPPVGEHRRRGRRVGIPQADGSAQVDEQVGRRHRRDVHPAVARHPGQAVHIVNELVERRGGHPGDVLHGRSVPTMLRFA
jgi:hypothetical protein